MFIALNHYFRTFVVFLFIFVLGNSSYGQGQKDTLQHKTNDELFGLYVKKHLSDTTTARKLANYYLNKAKKERDTANVIKAYECQLYISTFAVQLKYYDSIIALAKRNPTQKYPADSYFKKARISLYQMRDVEKSLRYIKEARAYAKANDNIDLLYRINYLVGNIKSEHLNEKEEAIQIFKTCAKHYATKTGDFFKKKYIYTNHVIAETYIALDNNDSASYYNNFGHQIAIASESNGVKRLQYLFKVCEGINQYDQGHYQAAIDSISKAIPEVIAIKDKTNLIDSYFYLGQSYFNLFKKDSAFYYFKKTDSILNTQKSIPQYKHIKTYEYLKNHYKDIGDLESRNAYLTKLNDVLRHYINDKVYIGTKVKEDYEIPVLMDEQKAVIKELNTTNSKYSLGLMISITFLCILVGVVYYQYRKRQKDYQRFKELMKEKHEPHKKHTTLEKTSTHESQQKLNISEKHVTHILQELEKFEKEKQFLSQGLSAKHLADQMETNAKYLSQVIKFHKNKPFITYLNDLRISYAVEELKQNTTLQKYTIKAISLEMGFSNAQTFSNAFTKQIGIKPSYFVEQLKKEQNS